MSGVPVTIDGKAVEVPEGTTLLEAAEGAGVSIPTLCHHEKLAPFAACRMCLVEAERDGRSRLVAACVAPVEPGWVVRTRSDRIDRFRKTLLELQLAHAPDAPALTELAGQYGADPRRFEPTASFCIHCGLCVRYCAEVKGAHAVGFVDRGIRKEISFLQDIAAQECPGCKECFPLCPTSYLQAAFVLAFPPQTSGDPDGDL